MWAVFGALALSAAAIIWGPVTGGFWQNILSNIALVGPGLFFTNVVARYSRERRLRRSVDPKIAQICGVINIEFATPAMKFATQQARIRDLDVGDEGIEVENAKKEVEEVVALRDASGVAAIDFVIDRIDQIESLLLSTIGAESTEVAELTIWHIYHMPLLLDAHLTHLSRYLYVAHVQASFAAVAEQLTNEVVPANVDGLPRRASLLNIFRSLAEAPGTPNRIDVDLDQLVVSLMEIGMHLRNGLISLRRELPGITEN